MVTPAYQDGDPRLRRLSFPDIDISKMFLRIGDAGIRRCGERDAVLFRTLATLRVDVPVFKSIDDLLWRGPAKDFKRTSERLRAPNLLKRALARKASLTI